MISFSETKKNPYDSASHKKSDAESKRSSAHADLKVAQSSYGKQKALNDIKAANRVLSKMKESTQIQELSKKTLGSYIKKAMKSKEKHDMVRGRATVRDRHVFDDQEKSHNKSMNRKIGILRSTDKLTKEDVDIQELSNKTLKSYVKKAADDHYNRFTHRKPSTRKKLDDRRSYIQKASVKTTGKKHFNDYDPKTKKFSKDVAEEVDIQELSTKTLQNYIKQASKSHQGNSAEAKEAKRTGRHKDYENHRAIMKKRNKGMTRAFKEEAPANNTGSGPGMGDDSTLNTKNKKKKIDTLSDFILRRNIKQRKQDVAG